MTVWTPRPPLVVGRNLLLVILWFAVVSFAAWTEGYWERLWWAFAGVLAIGFALSLWMAARASTVRFFTLLLAVFFLEYVKETLGIRTGLWTYHGSGGQYTFGVLAWTVAGVSVFAFGFGVTIPVIGILAKGGPRWLNLPIIAALFLLIPLTMTPAPTSGAVWFWGDYFALLVLALLASRRIPVHVLCGLMVSAWAVGTLGEWVGSTIAGIWTFRDHPRFPPFYLLAGCWPLEMFAQYALSAFLAGEPLSGDADDEPVPPKERVALRQLRIFLLLSGFTYFLVGFAFAVVPDTILGGTNAVLQLLGWNLRPVEVSHERFWPSLSFSMMMTIAALCFIAAGSIRRNKNYVVPLLVAKAASTLSSLVYLLVTHQFAALVIVVVDGSLFLLTLYFFLRAQRGFLLAQTGFLYGEMPKPRDDQPETIVAAISGNDKFACLETVLAQTRFFDVLEREWQRSGKARKDFRVVIKPNFMFMHAKADVSTYTDPALVERLVDRIAERGFEHITLVEAQSTYGNYYLDRDVLTVAEHVGYRLDRNYRIVDLTQEMVPFDYESRLGHHVVGPTWRDADFRISFAKNKTHVFCYYTLTLKNVYGTLPMQDKLCEYHTKREYDWPTIDALAKMPVHFGLIDAFVSADGQFGVIADPSPNPTQTIIGGENLMAVDWVGAKKMGLDPDDPLVGRFLPLAERRFGKPKIKWVGDTSTYANWDNVSPLLVYALDVIEEAYDFSNWWFSVLTAMDYRFTFAKTHWPTRAMRKVLAPVKRLLYPHDEL